MNPLDLLEQEYRNNVERANARDRRRELVIAFLTSGFLQPVSDVVIEDSMSGRTRRRIRTVLVILGVLQACAIAVSRYASADARANADIFLFVIAFAGLILGAKYVYGAWRRWHNARLELEWERRLGLDKKERS